MAELRDILESGDALPWQRPGIRFLPVPANDVPNEVVFLNSDGVSDRLCYKDGDGNVFRLRMQAT